MRVLVLQRTTSNGRDQGSSRCWTRDRFVAVNGEDPSLQGFQHFSDHTSFSSLRLIPKAARWAAVRARNRKLSTTLSARTRLLRGSVQQVAVHGWTDDAIIAGVEQEQLPLSMVGMITPIELVEWFMQDCNLQFASKLDHIQMDGMDTPERIAVAIQARLEYVLPVLATWHQGMALGAVQNSITTANQLEEIVTLIANKAGPLSSPVERTAIGAVYVATELHLLTDTSPNYQDTWTFLKLRVGELHSLQSQHHQNPFSSDSIVATAAVAASLAGGLVSLAPPAIARGMHSLVPQLLSLMTVPMANTTTTSTHSSNSLSMPHGSAPQDYEDLPPFPVDATSK